MRGSVVDPSGLHSGREPPVSQRPITDSKDIARVTGKDFIRRPKRFLHERELGLLACRCVDGRQGGYRFAVL